MRFLPKFDHIHLQISEVNLDQIWTYYSFLKPLESWQQYFDHSVVICDMRQKLLVKIKTEKPGIKIGRFWSTISNS
jgi:hypothetical protein